MSGGVAVALFTRDLRVHDNPVLTAAAQAEATVPLFVLDDAILGSAYNRPNRARFLAESLRDLHTTLRGLRLPVGLARGAVPGPNEICRGAVSPDLVPGGESAGRERMTAWLDGGLRRYSDRHDDRRPAVSGIDDGEAWSRDEQVNRFRSQSAGRSIG
jgi:deoxyribodipyrimidine photolyase